MSIHVSCPNGHALKVHESMAGKTGLCPACKARVQVPKLAAKDMSEDMILGLLDSPAANPDQADSLAEPPFSSRYSASPDPLPAGAIKKNCIKCHQPISAQMHICPFCHTYIAKPTDF
jgi:hypothetical protein